MKPTDLFPGYEFSNNNITIPISNLPVLSSSEASPTTGDGRELIRAFIEAAMLAYEATPIENRPKFMTITRGSIVGVSSSTIRRSFTISFEENIDAVSTSLRPES